VDDPDTDERIRRVGSAKLDQPCTERETWPAMPREKSTERLQREAESTDGAGEGPDCS